MEDQRKTIKVVEDILKKDPTILDRIKTPKDPMDQRETVKIVGKMLREDEDENKYED